MPLSPGDRLGPFEIVASIGKGGMGEVWKARDPRLGRDVAIKVSAHRFTDRFEREARAIAALNHPNICTLFDVGPDYLVMELVEGLTLADRIEEGPVPLEEALNVARQIADALDAAHEKGIVHRDLKPANIKLRPDGSVKVLDFGLAKSAQQAELSADSPTMTAGTQIGMILGTAGYMSPEQAKGKPVDKRADIFAFGVVLYEMLTGERLFRGETLSESLAAVIKEEPDWSKAPVRVERLLRKCLEKDPRKRLRGIGDWELLLSDLPAAAGRGVNAASAASRLAWIASGLLAVVAAGLGFVHFRGKPPLAPTSRFLISTPGRPLDPALSPDGRMLAFVASNGGPSQVWVRSMDALDARPLAGTEGATYPFWSPGGESLAFFAQNKLRRIAAAGGPPQTLCDADGRGGTWNRDGVILFANGPNGPILRVAAAGGVPSPVTRGDKADGGEICHRFPSFLPDGVHFLYTTAGCRSNREKEGIFVASLNETAQSRLLPDISRAEYAPASAPGESGHLLFRREDTLMAQPFDARALKTAGDLFPVAEHVPEGGNTGSGAFSVAQNGSLVYGSGAGANSELAWLDRTGKRVGTVGKPGLYAGHALSPDGKKLALTVTDQTTGGDIWLEDVASGVMSRFTLRSATARNPIWSPDGKRIAYVSLDSGSHFYLKPSDSNGRERLVLDAGVNGMIFDWSPDGKWIVYSQLSPKGGTEVLLLPVDAQAKPVRYLGPPFAQTRARFSPDGKWMAYQSNESGQDQIYVQAIPPGVKYQISPAGGTEPEWRRDGKELYYVAPDRKLMAVPVRIGATVEAGAPQPLFSVPSPFAINLNVYVSSRDGQLFLVSMPVTGSESPPLTLILNWQAGFRK